MYLFKYGAKYGKSGAQLIHAHITRSASITHPMWVWAGEAEQIKGSSQSPRFAAKTAKSFPIGAEREPRATRAEQNVVKQAERTKYYTLYMWCLGVKWA